MKVSTPHLPIIISRPDIYLDNPVDITDLIHFYKRNTQSLLTEFSVGTSIDCFNIVSFHSFDTYCGEIIDKWIKNTTDIVNIIPKLCISGSFNNCIFTDYSINLYKINYGYKIHRFAKTKNNGDLIGLEPFNNDIHYCVSTKNVRKIIKDHINIIPETELEYVKVKANYFLNGFMLFSKTYQDL